MSDQVTDATRRRRLAAVLRTLAKDRRESGHDPDIEWPCDGCGAKHSFALVCPSCLDFAADALEAMSVPVEGRPFTIVQNGRKVGSGHWHGERDGA